MSNAQMPGNPPPKFGGSAYGGGSFFNALPPVVVLLAMVIGAVELVLSAAEMGFVGGPQGIGWRIMVIQDYGFSPVVWDQVVNLGNYSQEMVRRFVTYGFVHGSFTHTLFALALLLALGKFVGEVFSWWALLLVVAAGLVAGASVFGILFDGPRPLFGIYPGVYALIGAFTYVLWLKLGQKGASQLQAFRLIGMLLVLQILFGAIFGTDWTWVAELSGFVVGFALSVVVSPGGLTALRHRLRER